MRKIIIMYSLMLSFSILIIFYKSISNKDTTKEEAYSLNVNYSYIYKENIAMDICIYSNIKKPRFTYQNMNKYYLCDDLEEFLVSAKVENITEKKVDGYFLYTFNIIAPNVNRLHVDKLYFMACNEYSDDKFMIGSLDIEEDLFLSQIPYKSLSKVVDENKILRRIEIELIQDVEIESIIMSKSFEYRYDYSNRKITLYLNSKNYTKSLYLIVKCSSGEILLDDYQINNSNVSFVGYEHFISIMERSIV